MSGNALTSYAVWDLLNPQPADNEQPHRVVQVLQIKLLNPEKTADNHRYKIKINDGTYFYSTCMCATQMSPMIKEHMSDSGRSYIVRITKSIITENKKSPTAPVLVIAELEFMRDADATPMGSPVDYDPTKNPRLTGAGNVPPLGVAQPSRKRPSEDQPVPAKRINADPRPTPAPVAGTATAGAGVAAPQTINPIASINPYQNKWCVRARVTNKSAIRHWNNSRGEGDVFSVELADESGEIKATGFNAEALRFHPLFEVNNVYYIQRGQVKPARKQFTSIQNDYEITFSSDTQVTPCDDAAAVSRLPKQQFRFVKIKDLVSLPTKKLVDVVGVVKYIGDVATLNSRATGKELQKRDLHLVDDSGTQVTLTLWGPDAQNVPTGSDNPVLVIKGAMTSDFGNACSLSAGASSLILYNPTDMPEGHRLRAWFDSGGGKDASVSMISSTGGGGAGSGPSPMSMIALSRAQNHGWGEKPDYVSLRGTVITIKKDNCMYMACPSADCNKKVIDGGDGMYRCEKCGKDFPEFTWRYIMSLCIADLSDSQWVMCFNEAAEALLGLNAPDLAKLKERDEDEFNQVFAAANYQTYTFRCRAKAETFNEETRIRYTAMSVIPGYSEDYNKFIEDEIKKALDA